MTAIATVIAHQGGWDEILVIVGPLVAVVGLLYWARNRQQTPATDDNRSTADRTAD